MKNGYGFGKFQQIRVYVYIIQSGDIYERGERNDSQIRVAPPRNNTHTIAFTVSVNTLENEKYNE